MGGTAAVQALTAGASRGFSRTVADNKSGDNLGGAGSAVHRFRDRVRKFSRFVVGSPFQSRSELQVANMASRSLVEPGTLDGMIRRRGDLIRSPIPVGKG
jgi:hypothetical protein